MRTLLAFLLIAAGALAEDIAGKWKATADGPNGVMERTFDFKVDGNKLSGETTSSFVGRSEIRNGKVDGGEISFTITIELQGDKVDVTYKGRVTGNTIKLTSEAAGNTFEWTGKKM